MTMNELDRLTDLKRALAPTDGPSPGLRGRALAGVPVRASRWRWAAPALAAASAAAVAGVLLVGGQPDAGDLQPAAFAVHVNADGSVTFAAHDVVDTAAATQA